MYIFVAQVAILITTNIFKNIPGCICKQLNVASYLL